MRIWIVVFLLGVLISGLRAEDTVAAASAPAVDEAKASGWIKDLASDEFDVREAAEKALAKLGKPAIGLLTKALEGASDAEARNRLRNILEALTAPLELSAEVVGDAVAGQPVKFKVLIKNIGEKDVVVVPCLDGSNRGKRFPKFSRSISPSPGPEALRAGCGNTNPLTLNDLVTLKPGAVLDVLGEHTFGGWLADWTPPKAGEYTLTFTCDYAQQDPVGWRCHEARTMEATESMTDKLARVPKITLTAKVTVTVK
ncbi:MAG: hypothetical protein KIS92_07040 [Planctomycetota bacterium]|nr:hypothetical protein [Planctomycetota bacterium]